MTESMTFADTESRSRMLTVDEEQKRAEPLQMNDEIVIDEETLKVLYIIGQYGSAAKTDGVETWVKHAHLLVILFECIRKGALDMDYAPSPVVMEDIYLVWMNVSQEALHAINIIREARYVRCLRVDEDGVTETAYQVSKLGAVLLKNIKTNAWQTSIDAVIFNTLRKAKTVRFVMTDDGGRFLLSFGTGSFVESAVTEMEEVPYVSSPYLPSCLTLNCKDPFTSNIDKVLITDTGGQAIGDPNVSEVLFLDTVKVLVGEWIPFGINQMGAMNKRAGSYANASLEMVPKSYFSNQTIPAKGTSTAPLLGDMSVTCSVGLTGVRVLDFDTFNYIIAEAEILFPEAGDVLQVEHIGVCFSVTGNAVYGFDLHSVMNKDGHNISVDHISRVLVDVILDSSEMVDSLLSPYQKGLLNSVYWGRSFLRPKYVIILAEQMKPKMICKEYLKDFECVNELQQIIGPILEAHDLNKEYSILKGENGLIFIGADSGKYEQILITHMAIVTTQQFVQAFYKRIRSELNTLSEIAQAITIAHTDPNTLKRCRIVFSQACEQLMLLKELFVILCDGLSRMNVEIDPAVLSDFVGKKLCTKLGISSGLRQLKDRVSDINRTFETFETKLNTVSTAISALSAEITQKIMMRIQRNTAQMDAVERASGNLNLSIHSVQTLMLGILALGLVHAGIGNWKASEATTIGFELATVPGLYLAMCIIVWMILWKMFAKSFRVQKGVRLETRIELTLNQKIRIKDLWEFLAAKKLAGEDTDYVLNKTYNVALRKDQLSCNAIRKATWQESERDAKLPLGVSKWMGSPPWITITFDAANEYLLDISLQFKRHNRQPERQEKLIVNTVLDNFASFIEAPTNVASKIKSTISVVQEVS